MVWTSWSFVDTLTPELFNFGFDPEILSCFWGIFRSSNDISGPPTRVIPDAPFQIIVPFRNSSDTGTFFSFLQYACGVALVVSLSSYGVYNILQSARGKLMKDVSNTNRSNVNASQMIISSHDDAVDPFFTNPRVPTPIRPTTLSVGVKTQYKFGLLSHRLRNNMSKDYEVDLDEVENIQDIEAEYFGPDAGTIDPEPISSSFDDSDFQTPCAGN